MAVTIRPMIPADLASTVASVLAGGWGERRAWFEFALAHPACDPVVAVDDGRVVGTAAGTRHGRSGWVGTVFVAPDRRREGIGGALTEEVCDRLETAGCETLLLVATELGRGIYDRLGFVEDGWYITFEAAGSSVASGGRPGGDIAPFRHDDVAEAAELDRAATGEDRGHLLAAFAGLPRGLALRGVDGGLRGFVVRAPWGLTRAPAA